MLNDRSAANRSDTTANDRLLYFMVQPFRRSIAFPRARSERPSSRNTYCLNEIAPADCFANRSKLRGIAWSLSQERNILVARWPLPEPIAAMAISLMAGQFQCRRHAMHTEDNIAALCREFTDALTEVLAENAGVSPVRRGRVARAHAAIKRHPGYNEHEFAWRWSSPLNSGRLYKTPAPPRSAIALKANNWPRRTAE